MLDNIFVGIIMVVAYLILPPCDREDSLNCYWDASVQGNGQGQSFFTLAVSDDMYGEKHPMPYNDKGLTSQINLDDFLSLSVKETYLFAFPDVDRLKKWLYEEEWIFELDRLGYVLSVYECDDGYHGDTQSIFNHEKAILVKRLRLMEV